MSDPSVYHSNCGPLYIRPQSHVSATSDVYPAPLTPKAPGWVLEAGAQPIEWPVSESARRERGCNQARLLRV